MNMRTFTLTEHTRDHLQDVEFVWAILPGQVLMVDDLYNLYHRLESRA